MALITGSTTVFGINTNHVAIFLKKKVSQHKSYKNCVEVKNLNMTSYSANTMLSCITVSNA
jgi:hypothetical protein